MSVSELIAPAGRTESRGPGTVAGLVRSSAATVWEYDHVAAAAYLMKHAGSAALMVLGTEGTKRPVGIITEADIARAVGDGMDVNETRIHDVMTARPTVLPAATSVRDAARIMVTQRFRQLPVSDDTRWIGIVDIADVCQALLGPLPA